MLELFQRMVDIREKIFALCSMCKCQHLDKCMKKHTVCSQNLKDNKRHIVSKSGGNFDEYIRIRNILVRQNMALVTFQAAKMGCNRMTIRDLIQEGNFGLIKAVERFEVERGRKFSTYAYSHIRKTILRYIRENEIVRKKGNMYDILRSLEYIYDRMVQDNDDISVDVMVQRIEIYRQTKGMTTIKIQRETIQSILDNLTFQTEKYKYKKNEESCEQEHEDDFFTLLNDKLEEDFFALPIATIEILKMRFGLGSYERPMQPKEIAMVMGMTRQGIDKVIKGFFKRDTIET